jgi:acyl dehydratase
MTNKIYWDDFEVGRVEWGTEVVADKDELLDYARKYDPWSFHVDEEAAAQTPFGGLIASGGYTISLYYLSGRGVWNLEDRPWAFLGGFDWKLKFLLPVRPGDRLRLKWTLLEKRPSSKPGRGHWLGFSEFTNQDDKVSLSIEAMLLMETRPEPPS